MSQRIMHPYRSTWPAVLVAVAGAQEAPAKLVDPAPPAVRELEPMAPPASRSYGGLRLHGAPRQLAQGAVTEESPQFLGPRRDGRTRERPLRLSWPAGGPKLVWEMRRGEGYASPVIAEGRLVFTHRTDGVTRIDCLQPETGSATGASATRPASKTTTSRTAARARRP